MPTVQVPAVGAWRPDKDPARIGVENFSVMQNMRYGDKHPEGVAGYRRMNFIPLQASTFYPAASSDDNYAQTSFDAAGNSCVIGADTSPTFFDNTKWQPRSSSFGAWDGAKWVCGSIAGTIVLRELGTWNVGFRPSYVRVYFTVTGKTYAPLQINPVGTAAMFYFYRYTSGSLLAANPTVNADISTLSLAGADGGSVTSITNIVFS